MIKKYIDGKFAYPTLTASLLAMICLLVTALGWANEHSSNVEARQFTYSWQFHNDSELSPRGGTSKGPETTKLSDVNPSWLELQKPGLSNFEKDRMAILSMAGEYRASFDFIETIGFAENYSPQKPYQSWGTEFIFVVENRENFISLQHILVMTVQNPDGKMSKPMTMKHWRQDWSYEDSQLNVYQGNNVWRMEQLSADSVQGHWTQAVYQVDDSPRYEGFGKWKHHSGASFWLSSETSRPVPRRETSVRRDYDYLLGTNRHTITPTGWTQEEDNLKVKIGENQANSLPERVVIAREAGLNRYERIIGFDFSPARDFWEKTNPFWGKVRAKWNNLLDQNDQYQLVKGAGGTSYLMSVLVEGDKISRNTVSDKRQNEFVDELFKRFVHAENDCGVQNESKKNCF